MTEYEKPNLTADAIVLMPKGRSYQILLIRRRFEPFAGFWALPGGFVQSGETTREASIRELAEETGVKAEPFMDMGIADKPGRDPRGWTVSGLWAFVVPPGTEIRAGDDAAEAAWFDFVRLPRLAFDHDEILQRTRQRISEMTERPDGWRALIPPAVKPTEKARERVFRVFKKRTKI